MPNIEASRIAMSSFAILMTAGASAKTKTTPG